MDILNWLYLAKNKFIRTTLSSTKDLMIFGANVGFTKRGDKYQNYAMSAEDFTTEVGNVVKPYKVYTALLTQVGESVTIGIYEGELTIGVTYLINGDAIGDGCDFTNVGAPNNNNGTYFIATGTTPNWNGTTNPDMLTYDTGAPVATVLENTIGNVWFTYGGDGQYNVKSNNLFTTNKTTFLTYLSFTGGAGDPNSNILFYSQCPSDYELGLFSVNNGTQVNDIITNTPIEIRVYN